MKANGQVSLLELDQFGRATGTESESSQEMSYQQRIMLHRLHRVLLEANL